MCAKTIGPDLRHALISLGQGINALLGGSYRLSQHITIRGEQKVPLYESTTSSRMLEGYALPSTGYPSFHLPSGYGLLKGVVI